jgi:hypothetical protein
MKVEFTHDEFKDLIGTVRYAIEAIESGGNEEERRFGGNQYNWQTMNDALRALKNIEALYT